MKNHGSNFVVNVNGGASYPFFDNQPDLLTPQRVADLLSLSIQTVYDWKYRQKLKRIPTDLFVKLNRKLYLRTSVLRDWFASQNPHIRGEGEQL